MRVYATLTIALVLASSGCAAAPATEATATAAPTQPFNVLGPEDAPVTIIEFTDLQCPYCAHAPQVHLLLSQGDRRLGVTSAGAP